MAAGCWWQPAALGLRPRVPGGLCLRLHLCVSWRAASASFWPVPSVVEVKSLVDQVSLRGSIVERTSISAGVLWGWGCGALGCQVQGGKAGRRRRCRRADLREALCSRLCVPAGQPACLMPGQGHQGLWTKCIQARQRCGPRLRALPTCSCACTSPKPVAVDAMDGRPLYLMRSGTSRPRACRERTAARAYVRAVRRGSTKQDKAALYEPAQPSHRHAGDGKQQCGTSSRGCGGAPPCSAAGAAARAGRRPCSLAPPGSTPPLQGGVEGGVGWGVGWGWGWDGGRGAWVSSQLRLLGCPRRSSQTVSSTGHSAHSQAAGATRSPCCAFRDAGTTARPRAHLRWGSAASRA